MLFGETTQWTTQLLKYKVIRHLMVSTDERRTKANFQLVVVPVLATGGRTH